jgi:hypothetical protein
MNSFINVVIHVVFINSNVETRNLDKLNYYMFVKYLTH